MNGNKADRHKSRVYTDTTTTITDSQQQQQLTHFKNLLTDKHIIVYWLVCTLTALPTNMFAYWYTFMMNFLHTAKKKKFVTSLDLLFSYVQSLSSDAFCFLPSSYPLPHPSPIGFHWRSASSSSLLSLIWGPKVKWDRQTDRQTDRPT